jgi:hypothetical protein
MKKLDFAERIMAMASSLSDAKQLSRLIGIKPWQGATLKQLKLAAYEKMRMNVDSVGHNLPDELLKKIQSAWEVGLFKE